jgi:tetraacyldisaccharide-1-P 4'-kinase
MVEYMIEMLKDKFTIATLSRGYKRKTKGYTLANDNSTALEIGDEPMQFYLKFPGSISSRWLKKGWKLFPSCCMITRNAGHSFR